MPHYADKETYRFHEDDCTDRCFICKYEAERLVIMRQIQSMKLVHLCADCIYDNLSDYLLDNTRPWIGDREKE